MKNTIKHILKEDRRERYFNTVAESFVKDATVFRLNLAFESSLELRDMGYEDGMIEFAYSNYGDYGFTYFEDEDGFKKAFVKEGEDGFWDSEDMVQEMMYNYIDKGVKDGFFIETTDGWEVVDNEFEITTLYGDYHLEYSCRSKSYIRHYNENLLEKILINKYGLTDTIDQESVAMLIYKKFTEILHPYKKVCH